MENSKIYSGFVNLLITNNEFIDVVNQMFSFCYFYNITEVLYNYYGIKYLFLLEICKI